MADDAEALQAPDRPRIETGLQRLKMRVEAAVETHQQHGRLEPRRCPARALEIEIERLLAKDRLARRCGGKHLLEMRVGRAGDDDRRHGGISERGVHVHHRGAGPLCQGIGGGAAGIHDELELEVGMRGRIAGVDLADAAGTEQGDVEH